MCKDVEKLKNKYIPEEDVEKLNKFKAIEEKLKNKYISEEERENLKEERAWLIATNPWLSMV